MMASLPRRPRRLEHDRDGAERHELAARLLGDAPTVLDVGGLPGRLAPHLPAARVTTANVVPPADVVFGGERLPFADGAFAAATSLDVLEHLPGAARAGHLDELRRVARARVVACCPLGTPEHVAAEAALAAWHERAVGRRDPYLDEHLARGLPTRAELEALAARGADAGWRATLRFHGDARVARELFRLGVITGAHARPGDRAHFLLRRLARGRQLDLAPAPGPHANRAFVVLERR